MGERISGGTGPDNQDGFEQNQISLTQMPFNLNVTQTNQTNGFTG